MDKMKMHSINKVDENVEKIERLFPNCVTESLVDDKLTKVVDFDMLKQELSSFVVEGRQERYQFTWPDKKKSILLANAPINKTLRPCREESVDFDNTENLYIEGDNLEVLKLLQETYLGKVKMIYIDPPYNTGEDFVYEDDFTQSAEEYIANSGQYDGEGNRLTYNPESNGRFHTDWLNMIYPRLKLARDLLTEDGVIFVSIDYNENYALRMMLTEIFGNAGFVGEIYWESKTKSQNTESAYNKLQPKAEMILVYTKTAGRRFNLVQKGTKEYPLHDDQGQYREYVLEVMNANGIRGRESMVFDITDGVSTVSPPEGKQWKLGQAQVATYQNSNNLFIRNGQVIIKMRPEFERVEKTEPFWGLFGKNFGTTESAKKELEKIVGKHGFDTVKPEFLVHRLALHATAENDIVLDFFSGSATTAHAVIQLNADDGGHRKFIMIQIPEKTAEKSEAHKAGYKNICEIGKRRIRLAGEKIMSNSPLTRMKLDIGFRVLKCDSSNMKDVYYSPAEYEQPLFSSLADNIKEDRTPEDLLFQVMLDLGVLLSSKIEEITIAGKKVFSVAEGYLIACFDENITDVTIKEVAQKKPYYFVMRDGGYANDSVATNFDQIFAAYSPSTIRKVL